MFRSFSMICPFPVFFFTNFLHGFIQPFPKWFLFCGLSKFPLQRHLSSGCCLLEYHQPHKASSYSHQEKYWSLLEFSYYLCLVACYVVIYYMLLQESTFFDSLHYYISFYTIRNSNVIELLLFDNCYWTKHIYTLN